MTIPLSLGLQWLSWVRHCAPRRKIAGLVLHRVIGIIELTIPAAIWPGFVSASNRNEYQGYVQGDKGGRCLRLTTYLLNVPTLEIFWEPQTPGALRRGPAL